MYKQVKIYEMMPSRGNNFM